jgi:hypothetical protein
VAWKEAVVAMVSAVAVEVVAEAEADVEKKPWWVRCGFQRRWPWRSRQGGRGRAAVEGRGRGSSSPHTPVLDPKHAIYNKDPGEVSAVCVACTTYNVKALLNIF